MKIVAFLTLLTKIPPGVAEVCFSCVHTVTTFSDLFTLENYLVDVKNIHLVWNQGKNTAKSGCILREKVRNH